MATMVTQLSGRKPSEVINELPYGELGLWGAINALAWYIESPTYGQMLEEGEYES